MPTGSGRCRFSRQRYRRRLLLELREDEPHELDDLDDEDEDEPHELLAGFDDELLEEPHEELVEAGLLVELGVLPQDDEDVVVAGLLALEVLPQEEVVEPVDLAAVDEDEPHEEELVDAGLLAVVVVVGAEKAETFWVFFDGSVTS